MSYLGAPATTQQGNFFDTLISAIQAKANSAGSGYRSGANEADRIVPFQNSLVDGILAPIDAQYPTATGPELQQMWSTLSLNWVKFVTFIGDTAQFPDGRASAQAFATLKPYFDDAFNGIRARLTATGYTIPTSAVIQGAGVPSLGIPSSGGSNPTPAGTLPVRGATTPVINYPGQPVATAGISQSSLLIVAAIAAVAFLVPPGRK